VAFEYAAPPWAGRLARRLELAAYPAGTRPEAPEGAVIVKRPHTVLVAGWPAAA
jgi:hypothetical protein